MKESKENIILINWEENSKQDRDSWCCAGDYGIQTTVDWLRKTHSIGLPLVQESLEYLGIRRHLLVLLGPVDTSDDMIPAHAQTFSVQ